MLNCKIILNLYQTLLTAKHLFDASFSSAKIKTANPDVKSGSQPDHWDKQSIDQASQSFQALESAYADLKSVFPPELFYPKNPSFTHTTPEGKIETISVKEQLIYWSRIYKDLNINWINLPNSITLTPDQVTQMQELMNQGFTKMLIIPENLVDNPTITIDANNKKQISNPKYEQLHQLTTVGYKDKTGNLTQTHTWGDYIQDGKFQGSKDKSTKLRIILTKDVQNIDDDELFKTTKDLSIEQLEKDPKFSHLLHLTESIYLVYQREYFKRTGRHLDKSGWTWLPVSERPLSGRVPCAYWNSGFERLYLNSDSRVNHNSFLGCRLAGSFEVKI